MAIRRDVSSIKGRAYYVSQRARYLNNAKEAAATGDRVLSEYNLQYADHFNRIITEKFPQVPTPQNAAAGQDPEASSIGEPTGVEPTDRVTPIKRYRPTPGRR